MSDQLVPPHPNAKMLWLWKSGDHYLAFDTPRPEVNGNPIMYGDAHAYAWLVAPEQLVSELSDPKGSET